MSAAYVNKEQYEELVRLLYNINVPGAGVRYSARRFAPAAGQPGITITLPPGQRRTASVVYEGPFAVSIKDATTLRVKSGVSYAGATAIASPETEIVDTSGGVVYLKITHDGTTYKSEIHVDSVLLEPAQMPPYDYIVELARFEAKAGALTAVNQSQYGNIYVQGRVV